MSEYQYYEFQAIDRPLTDEQMAKLRSITSRAEITSTRLTNVYHWGDFNGGPVELLVAPFDAHLYEANWGTRRLMFGFPRRLVDVARLNAYQVEAGSEDRAAPAAPRPKGRIDGAAAQGPAHPLGLSGAFGSWTRYHL